MSQVSLASFVAAEHGVTTASIMLLRHSNSIVRSLLACGGSLESYTSIQPTNSKYDYLNPKYPPVSLVIVIVDDTVETIYRVLGVEREGTTYSLVPAAHREFDINRGVKDRPARKFFLQSVRSVAVGNRVAGWERRTRTPVQRSHDGFFYEIKIHQSDIPITEIDLQLRLSEAVALSLNSSHSARAERIRKSNGTPQRVEVLAYAFVRNPDVIAEVLVRASGCCERCGQPAPFIRRADGTPYLEVHHKKRLADGGLDLPENAEALCPNCHRRAHYA